MGGPLHRHVLARLWDRALNLVRRLVKGPRWPSSPITGRVTLGRGTWTVEVVLTAHDRRVGLGGSEVLAPGTGMLFIHRRARPRVHTMRGCLVPLDIAFVAADRRVVAVYAMEVEPDGAGRRSYPSGTPARYVLEVPAGELAHAGVVVGARASFSREVPHAVWADPWP